VLDKIHGLPAHVLLIHAVVVLVPAAALMLVASAVWPAARAKLGFLTPAVALVALALVPITTQAGHWLQDHLRNNEGKVNPLILRHAELGDGLLPWAIGIFVMSAAVWVLSRRYDLAWSTAPAPRTAAVPVGVGGPAIDGATAGEAEGAPAATRTAGRALPLWATSLVAALSIAVAVGGVVQLVRIGDSGAQAAWDGRTTG
jgi:hypothetical protein